MLAITAESASVRWDEKKKSWTLSIKIGAEVIRRSADHSLARDASDEALRAWVVQTAKDEGYELPAGKIAIER
jgi:hypothetical protein